LAPGSPGRVVAIQIGRLAEGRLESVPEVRAVPGKGLEGDRYFRGEGSFSRNPGGGRQVTLVASEMLELLQSEHGIALPASETRRNLVTKGVSLNELVDRVFQVGSVRMKGVRLAEPCDHLERLTQPGVLKGLVHRAGLRADILDEGVLRVGDEIVSSPEPRSPRP
jgi:MOSC domain-containing protein YiiM